MDTERNRPANRPTSRTVAARSRDRFLVGVVLNRRRRYVLYYLHESSGPAALDDIAAQVAAWERETTPDEVARERVESVRSSLRRTHLPYLADRNLVAYDAGRGVATGQVEDPEIAVFLANDPRTEVSWYRVYLALTAVSAAVLGLVRFDVPPFDRIGPVAAAALVVVLFALASLGYWYDVRRWRRRTEDTPPDFLITLEEDVPLESRDAESGNAESGNAESGNAESGNAESKDDRGGRGD